MALSNLPRARPLLRLATGPLLLALLAPAAAVAREDALASLPSSPPPLGVAQLEQRVSCPRLQQRLTAVLGAEASAWSVSVADPMGRLLADLNGLQPRVPASNQKLVTTAFALDRLGPDYRLRTRLWRLPDGTLRLTGEGDPDLGLPQLQRFAMLALGQGSTAAATPEALRLELAEEPPQSWWPSGWSPGDRVYAYGAPITRLAVTSNTIQDAVQNPPSRLQSLLQRTLRGSGEQVQLPLVSARSPLPADAVLVHEEPSTSMAGLLSLANTDSHNFTSEVLLRQAAGTWTLSEAQTRLHTWLAQQGVPMQGVRIADGSGLDRANRLTSRALTALLLRMDQHPNGRAFLGSMAIAGQRGTLRSLYGEGPLQGRFLGKTGTMRGVRSISGVLITAGGPRYVSAISNGAGNPNTQIGQLLRLVQNTDLCAD